MTNWWLKCLPEKSIQSSRWSGSIWRKSTPWRCRCRWIWASGRTGGIWNTDLRGAMKAYLLGAGASRSYELSPTGSECRSARDVFEIFSKLKISSNQWVLIGDIINHVSESRNIPPEEFGTFNEDIEEVFSEAEENLLAAIDGDQDVEIILASRLVNQLIFLFASIVNEIQNGPISEAHRNLARTLSQRRSDHNLQLGHLDGSRFKDRDFVETRFWLSRPPASDRPKRLGVSHTSALLAPPCCSSCTDRPIGLRATTRWKRGKPTSDANFRSQHFVRVRINRRTVRNLCWKVYGRLRAFLIWLLSAEFARRPGQTCS